MRTLSIIVEVNSKMISATDDMLKYVNQNI